MLVRQMLTGVAEAVDLDGGDLNDISTAVTEACNNVVLHAYEGDGGAARGRAVCLSRHGRGGGARSRHADIRIPLGRSGETAGIGLSVIQTLARRADFKDVEDGGTEVLHGVRDAPGASARRHFQMTSLALPASAESGLATRDRDHDRARAAWRGRFSPGC